MLFQTGALAELLCYVCGSNKLRYEKCKVFCESCGTLIENCSGD